MTINIDSAPVVHTNRDIDSNILINLIQLNKKNTPLFRIHSKLHLVHVTKKVETLYFIEILMRPCVIRTNRYINIIFLYKFNPIKSLKKKKKKSSTSCL